MLYNSPIHSLLPFQYAFKYVCIYLSIYMCVCVCVCVCIYTHIYIYTQNLFVNFLSSVLFLPYVLHSGFFLSLWNNCYNWTFTCCSINLYFLLTSFLVLLSFCWCSSSKVSLKCAIDVHLFTHFKMPLTS